MTEAEKLRARLLEEFDHHEAVYKRALDRVDRADLWMRVSIVALPVSIIAFQLLCYWLAEGNWP